MKVCILSACLFSILALQCVAAVKKVLPFTGIAGPYTTLQARESTNTENASLKTLFAKIPVGVRTGIASGLAAAVCKCVLQPFDTIKTVQQTEKVFRSPAITAMNIINERGISKLWSGLGVTVLGSSPSVAVYFGCYSASKSFFTEMLPENMKLLAVAVSAVIGNSIASVLRVPYEVIKQRLQTGVHKSTIEAILYISKNEGVGLLGGGKLTSQMLRDIPYAVATLMSYEILQSVLSDKMGDKKVKDVVCGSMAGGFGAFVTTPMDLIKTRMMKGGEYSNIFNAINRISKEEGLAAFMTGMTPRLMQKIPANGLFFLCYETFKTLLGVKEEKLLL